MRRSSILVAALCVTALTTNAQEVSTTVSLQLSNDEYVTQLPPGEWELIEELSDEFNGTELDRTKWIDYHPYWSGRTPSEFNKDNISVKDGYLQLLTSLSNEEYVGQDSPNWIYTACVTSKNQNCDYGYYEARMKACNLSMSNAFWFQSKGETIEIDVTESIGNSKKIPSDSYSMNINTHDIRQGGWDNDITTPFQVDFPQKKRSSEIFYTYGVLWSEDNIEFYLDGKKVHEVKKDDFNQKMYMFFDVEAFKWQGYPTKADLLKDPSERTLYVDYVRAYRRK